MAEHIYFQKNTGHFQVAKKIDGVQYSFGTYDTYEKAVKVRDYFKNNGWDTQKRLMFSKNSFINFYNGKYYVHKILNGKRVSFGFFNTFEEAEYQVELCKRFGWDLRLKPFDCMKHIQKRVHDSGKIVYRIVRYENGKQVYYGSFNNLDDAQFERDLLLLCDWDYNNLESIDETIHGHYFLDGVKALTQPIYKSPNGRIDYGVI